MSAVAGSPPWVAVPTSLGLPGSAAAGGQLAGGPAQVNYVSNQLDAPFINPSPSISPSPREATPTSRTVWVEQTQTEPRISLRIKPE